MGFSVTCLHNVQFISKCVKVFMLIDKSIPSKFVTMLCRQRFDKQGTVARDQSGSSAMILLLIFLLSSAGLRSTTEGWEDLDIVVCSLFSA